MRWDVGRFRRPRRRLKLQQVDFRQHGRAPWALTVGGQGGAFGSLAAALRAGASAASGISRGTKIFCQTCLSHKGYPLYGQNHFWTGF